jgi:hypothetical protein
MIPASSPDADRSRLLNPEIIIPGVMGLAGQSQRFQINDINSVRIPSDA